MMNENEGYDASTASQTQSGYPNKPKFTITYIRVFVFGFGGIRIESKDVNALNFLTNWYHNELGGRVKQNNDTCITFKEYPSIFQQNLITNPLKYHWSMMIADKLGEIGYEMCSANQPHLCYHFKAKTEM